MSRTACFPVVLALSLVMDVGDARAAEGADSLAVPIAADSSAELWPIEVTVEITTVEDEDLPCPLPERRLVVTDGHRLSFDNVIRTPRGRQSYRLDVVARHHPGRAVEIEWDLEVSEARYRLTPDLRGWGRWLMHRLSLGPRPTVGPDALRIARSDIVSVAGDAYRERIQIGPETVEIRIWGRSMRG